MTMQTVEFLSTSVDDTGRLAQALAREVRQRDVVVLAGDLGAGKTTFTKAFCAALGVTDHVTSPTFTLVHEYRGSTLTVCHADLYRLERTGELADLGLEDARRKGAVLVVEWGDLAPAEFPDALIVSFAHMGDDARSIWVSWRGASWEVRFMRIAEHVQKLAKP